MTESTCIYMSCYMYTCWQSSKGHHFPDNGLGATTSYYCILMSCQQFPFHYCQREYNWLPLLDPVLSNLQKLAVWFEEPVQETKWAMGLNILSMTCMFSSAEGPFDQKVFCRTCKQRAIWPKGILQDLQAESALSNSVRYALLPNCL